LRLALDGEREREREREIGRKALRNGAACEDGDAAWRIGGGHVILLLLLLLIIIIIIT